MGFDKATAPIGGVPCAVIVASALGQVARVVLEVGPGVTGHPAVSEEPPGAGPLAAVATGARALRERGYALDTLVVACDFPLVSRAALAVLASWPGNRSVVPVVDGHPQPLFARWSPADLALAADLVVDGARAMRSLVARTGPILVPEHRWPAGLDRRTLTDVDSPADLDALGIPWQRPPAPAPLLP